MHERYVLLKFCRDWADEMSAEGFRVVPESEWDRIRSLDPETLYTYYFGTNEGWDDETVLSYLECIDATLLSQQELSVLSSLFTVRGDIEFGQIPSFDPEDLEYDDYDGEE